MNKLFFSLVLLSFGASAFAQSLQQANPFNYYKTDNIFKTELQNLYTIILCCIKKYKKL
jgi:hypothetical protein